MNISEKWW